MKHRKFWKCFWISMAAATALAGVLLVVAGTVGRLLPELPCSRRQDRERRNAMNRGGQIHARR